MAGWASGNRFAIIGGIRAVAMLLSYEIPMGIAAAGVVLVAGSLSLSEVVSNQIIPNALFQPLGFITFLIASTAELNRSPFDITEAESELVAGYMTDYSSMKFGLFYLGEFMATIASSAVIVVAYFSGWRGPGFLPPELWFILKWIGVIAIFIWFRATFPRLRIDQIMALAWKGLFELSLLNILILAMMIAIWPDPTGLQLLLMVGINWVVFVLSIYIFGRLLSPDLSGNKMNKRKVVYGLD
jgi:NADH-quinone oxidoreductase subunit H